MTIILKIIALWLLPGILAYAIASFYSKDWTINDKDIVLIVPILNAVMLAFVLLLTVEMLISKVINYFTKESV